MHCLGPRCVSLALTLLLAITRPAQDDLSHKSQAIEDRNIRAKEYYRDTQTRRSAHMTDVVRCVHLNQETVRIIKFEGFLRITTVEFQIELT